MTERLVVGQAGLERCFPDKKKRQLARDFIELVQKVAIVSRVIAYNLSGKQRIMVISFGDTSPNDPDGRIEAVYGEFLTHPHYGEVLGSPNMITGRQYDEVIQCDSEDDGETISVLWDRKSATFGVAA